MVALWRLTWSHARGVYWLRVRDCSVDTAEAWKAEFEKDDAPSAVYVLSAKTPAIKPGDDKRALHVATL
jgi:hypothetical protein